MAQKSIKKNYLYNLTYQLLSIFIPLITTPYLSRILGAEAIGIYSYTVSITTYFILFGSLGVAMYGQREIAYIQNDVKNRSKVFFEILCMRFITLFISLIVFYCSFVSNGDYKIYYKILILEIIANSVDISWFFQGLEEFKKTVVRNLIVKLISVFCVFLFVKCVDDLNNYFWIYVLSTLIGNVSLWMYLPKYINKVTLKELKMFRHLKPTISLFIPQIAIQIYTVLDKTMIGSIVVDKSEVGFYEQAQKIIKLLITIATALGTVMLPRMAKIYAENDNEKLKDYLRKSFRFTLFLSFPLMFGIISISNRFVPIFYGIGYDEVVNLIRIISPIVVFIGLSNIIGTQYLLITKQQGKFTLSVTVGACVNAILNYILINVYGAFGASISTVAAEFCVTFLQLLFVKNEIDWIEICCIGKKYFFASLIMTSICFIFGYYADYTFISLFIQIIIGVFSYFTTLVLLKDVLILNILKTIFYEFKKELIK